MLPYTGTYAGSASRSRTDSSWRPGAAGNWAAARSTYQGRRRIRAGEGDRQHQPADHTRQGRRRRRHRALGRRRGDDPREGGRPAHHSERRRPRDRAALRAEHLPHVVLELAVGLRDGRRAGQGRQAGGDALLEVRRRRGVREGLQDGYAKGGGQIVKDLWIPFPNVEFQALLTEIASLKPDAAYAFFAGAGAAKLLRDYAQAGPQGQDPARRSRLPDRGRARAPGGSAQKGANLHYADGLGTEATTRSARPTRRPSRRNPTSTRCRATTRPVARRGSDAP